MYNTGKARVPKREIVRISRIVTRFTEPILQVRPTGYISLLFPNNLSPSLGKNILTISSHFYPIPGIIIRK